MKILIDPVYTSSIGRCASFSKFVKIVLYLLDIYDDLYIYWIIPTNISKNDERYLLQSDNIRYIKLTMSSDRQRLYYGLPPELDYIVSFNGTYWDYDILITNKTSLVPIYKMLQFKPSSSKIQWSRKILLLEDMPIMSFKSTLHRVCKDVGDRLVIDGYLASDKVLMSSFWEKKEVLNIAKRYYSPAMVRELSSKFIESAPHEVTKINFKSKALVKSIIDKEIPFTVSYSGRMVKSDQVDDVFKVLESSWICNNKGGNFRTVMTTPSTGKGSSKVKPPECVNLVYADRDVFWGIVKNESAVGLFLSREEDYSMSMLEPMLLGLPMAIIKAKHSVATIGHNYPFFVSGIPQAYGVIELFYKDYAKYYKIFCRWANNELLPLLKDRNTTNILSESHKLIKEFQNDFDTYRALGKHNDSLTKLLAAKYNVGESSTLEGKVKALHKKGVFRVNMPDRFGDRDRRNMTFSTEWNMIRNALKASHNFIDSGIEVGELKRVL